MSEVLTVAQEFLSKVRKSGATQIMAICPFHMRPDGSPERNPSFTMNLQSGLYHCFSCHESGNLQMFLRNVGVTRVIIEKKYRALIDAVQEYAPTKVDPLRPELSGLENSPIPEEILGLFEYCPEDLILEGYDEGLLQRLDIGFDTVHMRVTYPLRTLDGTLVGISGRRVDEAKGPRYKVYDVEFEAWDLPVHKTYKSHLLWNGHQVYPMTTYMRGVPIIVVEGFKACMRVIQAGVPNVVAIIGSMLSNRQKWLLERMAGEVWWFLDNNGAGFEGTVVAGRTIGVPSRIVPYDADQPSDLRVHEVQLALSHVIDFHRWFLSSTPAQELWRERLRAKGNQFENS